MTTDVTTLLSDLIALPSVNPQDGDVLEPPFGEQGMADYIENWLRRAGLDVRQEEIEPGRANVLAIAEGSQSDKTLLLSAHMDTVGVQGMTIDPFMPGVRDGRIYGRGSCDDKGPLAVLMMAFAERACRGKLSCNLAFLATCGEEYNLLGARHCAKTIGSKLIGAVMAEPTNHHVVVAHKGVMRLNLACSGTSAHSSTPQQGDNAVYKMARALLAVEAFGNELAGRPAHPRLQTETLSATIVAGGQQINVIPDVCTAKVDWRLLPGRTPEDCREELSAWLLDRLPDVPVAIETINQYESMETNENAQLVQRLLAAARQFADAPEAVVVGYATDASALSHLNIPTPIFGPGDVAQAHTQNEFIEIAELEKGLRAYQYFLDADWF